VVRRERTETAKMGESELPSKNLESTRLKGLENTYRNRRDSRWRTV